MNVREVMLRGKVLLVKEDQVKITAHAFFVLEPFGLTEADIWHRRAADRATITQVGNEMGSRPNAVLL